MNRTKSILVAASIALVLAFTISCGLTGEVGGDSSEGGGSFKENSQIFQYDGAHKDNVFKAYTGDGIVKMVLCCDSGDTLIDAGSVTGGFVKLDSPLPTPPDKYLEVTNSEEYKAAGCTVSANDVKFRYSSFRLYDGDEPVAHFLNPTYGDETIEEDADYLYVTKDVNIICPKRVIEVENGRKVSTSVNMKLKAGWNIVYEIEKYDPSTRKKIATETSTDNIITKELKWMLY